MSRANTVQTNFTSGELSPNMYGRVDVSKYFNGVRKLRNMIPLPQGGVTRRPGTEYLGTVADSTKKTLVRTFTYSNNDSYVLEFGHEVIRIWQSGALVGAPVTVVTPYGQNDLAQLRFVQSADVLFIAHPSYYPRVLTRTAHTSWALSTYDNKDGPYLSTTPEIDLTVSEVTDRATATCISGIFTTSGSPKTITGVSAYSATDNRIKLKIVGHGYSASVRYPVLVAGVVGVPECLGAWQISGIDADYVYLHGSRMSSTSAYVSGGTTVGVSGTHVEYREENKWKLARIISIASSTVATVDIEDAVVYPDEGIKISAYLSTVFLAASTTASSPTFTYNDVYKVIRPTSFNTPGGETNFGWDVITEFVDSEMVTCTRLATLNYNDPTKLVTISNRTVTGKITASSAYFASTDVDRLLRLKFGSRWIPMEITSYSSTTVVSFTSEYDIPLDTGAVYQYYNNGKALAWKIGAWCSTTGYPAVVSFHQNRLVWKSSTAEPSTSWFTKVGDYYNFEPSDPANSSVYDDSAMTMTLVSRQVNKARWIDSGPVLLIGTEGAEWQIKPSSIQQNLTPTNFSATVQTAYGSADLDCHRIGSQTLFIERSLLKLRELSYDFSIDAFGSKDISILSEHILRENSGVVDWCAQSKPYSILWLILGNGKVASVTYEREHDVIAWSLHDFGGTAKSCCAVPTASSDDEVYFIIERVINGSTVKCVERIRNLLNPNTFLDCAGKQDFGSVQNITTSTAATHLASATVGVTLDGIYLGSQTSSGAGAVNVNYRGQVVWVGLLNTPIIGLLDPEGGSQAGTSQGKKKRITESVARVLNSYYFQIASASGVTNDTENLTASRDPETADRTRIVPALTLNSTGSNVPSSTFGLVSGDIAFSVDDAFDNGGRFELVQPEPYQLTVVAIMHKLNTNE